MKRRVVTSAAAFAELAEPWDELVAAGERPEVFLRHAWFTAYLRAYDAADRLRVETLWRDGQLVGVAPLQRGTLAFRGLRGRALRFLSSPVAPRCSFPVADPADLAPLLDGLLEDRGWDVLVTDNLPAADAVTAAFVAWLRERGLPFQDAPGFQSPYLPIDGSWAEHWAGLDRERRRYLKKKCTNRLAREPGHRFERIERVADLEALLPALYRLSEKSWKAGADAALTPDSPDARLLVDFARVGLERGWVRLDVLHLDDEPIAFEYMLVSDGRYSVVRSDFDQARKYLTPGNSLRLHVVEDLFDSGRATEYDLGGDPHPYKLEWCDALRDHRTFTAAHGTWRGRAILLAKNVVLPALRTLTGRGDAHAA